MLLVFQFHHAASVAKCIRFAHGKHSNLLYWRFVNVNEPAPGFNSIALDDSRADNLIIGAFVKGLQLTFTKLHFQRRKNTGKVRDKLTEDVT